MSNLTLPSRLMHEDTLYLPQQTWAKNGSKVTFVGMMHIAPPEFFEQMERKLADYADAGGVILAEGVQPEVKGQKTADEEILAEFLDGVSLMMHGMASTKLVHQRDALKIEGVPVDMHSREILPHLGLRRMRLMSRLVHRLAESGEIKPFANDTEGREKARDLLRGREKGVSFRLWLMGMPEKYILTKRNERALSFTANGLSHLHTVLPWGAAHLPGMDSILLKRGYERVGVQNWHPVMRVSDLVDTTTPVL